MNKIFLNNIGDLAETQHISYSRFLLKGIQEELSVIPTYIYSIYILPNIFNQKKSKLINLKIEDILNLYNLKKKLNRFIKIERVLIYKNEIKFKYNKNSVEQVFLKDKNYTIKLYVKGRVVNTKTFLNINTDKIFNKNKVNFEKYFYLGEIPLMTGEGTFILNGCERVIINQIIKSPGVFFKKLKEVRANKNLFIATIVSNTGLMTNIYYDCEEYIDVIKKKKFKNFSKKEQIYIKLKSFSYLLNTDYGTQGYDSSKLYLFDIIKYLISKSISFKNIDVLNILKHANIFFKQKLSQTHNDKEEFLSVEEKINLNNITKRNIEKIISDKEGNFYIGETGRYNINKKLKLILPKNITKLTHFDFLHIIDALIEIKYYGRPYDDMDHIKEKKIRTCGDFLQNYLKDSFIKSLIEKNRDQDNNEFNFFKKLKPLFFKNNNIYNNIDSTNKNLSRYNYDNLYHNKHNIFKFNTLRRIKDFKRTIIQNELAQYMDQTNPLADLTHKRRLSLLGPDGLDRGCVPGVVRDIHPSRHGKICPIETPEGGNAGLLSSISMYARISLYGWIETPYFLTNNFNGLKLREALYLNSLQDSHINIAFSNITLNNLGLITSKYLSSKKNYSFSVKNIKDVPFVTTSPIQILSLATSLIPFVEHNDANRALMGSNMQRQAMPLLITQKPLVGTGFEVSACLDSGMVLKSIAEGYVLYSSSKLIVIKDIINEFIITYKLRKYKQSNQYTAWNQKPVVWLGEKVFSNQIIADGPSTNDGELSLGRNLIVAYMPWEGYNYEDAIIINERLIYEDILTSVHIEEHDLKIKGSECSYDILSRDIPFQTEYAKRHLDYEGISRIGSYVYENDILIGKLSEISTNKLSPEEEFLESIFGPLKLYANYTNSSLLVPIGMEGRVIDIRTFLNKNLKIRIENENLNKLTINFCNKIRIFIGQVKKIQIGDKLSGRHGNKGIVSRILSQQDMPYLPDGTIADILLNPLGVPSRMNVGQIFECLLGLAAENLKQRFKITPFDEIYGSEASRILTNQKLKEAAIKSNKNFIFNYTIPGKIYLRDGRTGDFFDNPITVGKSYILKLIHIVEDKIHARSVGPYSIITEQPLKGKSSRGGQRFGEMEVWALEAHGCSYLLKELLTLKSDDIDGRKDIFNNIINNTNKPAGSINETFLVLIRELNSLGLYFSTHNIKNGFYITSNIEISEIDLFKETENRLKLRRKKDIYIYNI